MIIYVLLKTNHENTKYGKHEIFYLFFVFSPFRAFVINIFYSDIPASITVPLK